MQIAYLLILGLVQGLTEFLPVSSSGHLVLLGKWFGIPDNLFVSIILHVATLLAVVVCFRKEIWEIVKHPFGELATKLYVATMPTCVIVLIIMPFINEAFEGRGLAFSFLASALILLCASVISKKHKSTQKLTYKHAFLMGIAQGFATLPGVSRSGTTISAGLISGVDGEESAKFSFLMSIPIIILSLLLEVYKIFAHGQAVQVNVLGLVLGFVIAFVAGIFSIKFMLSITKKAGLVWFAAYLVIVSILTFLM